MARQKRIEAYGRDVMINIIYDILRSDWPEGFKKHILLRELLWKLDSPKGVKGDNSKIIFSAKAKAKWKLNECAGVRPKDGIIIEHAVPRLEVWKALTNQPRLTKKRIQNTLESLIVRVAVTVDEDNELNKLGLRQKMPEEWDGGDLMARHKAAKIRHVRWLPEKYLATNT